MFGWHHWLNAHEFEQTLGDGGGQGSLVCCSPRGHKESDTTERLNSNKGDYAQQCGWASSNQLKAIRAKSEVF